MCGITGIVGSNPIVQDASIIQRMTDSVAHRGPDAESTWSSPGVSLGHRRLSIIDLTTHSNQPFFDTTRRYCMVFNGEIYNYKEIKKQLPDYPFESQSDTEVLLASYIRWGKDCLERLNGMFAFAIWDTHEKVLFCARDRLGIKPFYYFKKENYFVFASEVKALLASQLPSRTLNKGALADFLHYQTTLGSSTILQGIQQLPAGCYAEWKNDRLQIRSYWDIHASRILQERTQEQIQQSVREYMLQAVERRMISDVPLGAFLSGGIDSSAVVACMATLSEQPVHTFSVGFKEAQFDESKYAALIAQKYKTEHTHIQLEAKDFLRELPTILSHMDVPSGDGPNTYIVSQKTKQAGITVALSGLGGDELFAGYQAHFLNYLHAQKYKNFWKLPRNARRLAATILTKIMRTTRGQKAAQLLSLENTTFEHLYPIFRQAFTPEEVVYLTRSSTQSHAIRGQFSSLDLQQIDALPILSQASVGEWSLYTRDLLLRDTDQMSMAHSLEIRVPFFDHTLVEYVLSVPDAIKYPTFPKQLLVDSLHPMLPDAIVHRPKMGFTLPWEVWIKNELQTFCEHNIQHLAQRNIVDGPRLQRYWKRFQKGDPSIIWSRIWQLVSLGHWVEQYDIH